LSILIPVGVSNRHMHLTREATDTLFGPGSELTVFRDLYQTGEFASQQFVEMVGPRGRIPKVRILGPLRIKLQIEISRTDAFHLGNNPPVGIFGKLPPGETVVLNGPAGSLSLTGNIMISRRHIHCNSEEAEKIGVKDGDAVFVVPATIRGNPAESRMTIMGNTLIRVNDTYRLQMHVDTDEANAAGMVTGDMVFVINNINTPSQSTNKKLITEEDVKIAVLQKQKIRILPGMIVTPAARDLGKEKNIFF
jgi:putative phosphotransacetylase